MITQGETLCLCTTTGRGAPSPLPIHQMTAPRANTRKGSIFQSIIETEIVREAAGPLGLAAAAGASRVLMDG